VLGVLSCYAGAPEQHEDLLTVLLDGVAAQIGAYVARRPAEELARQLTRAKDDFIAPPCGTWWTSCSTWPAWTPDTSA
jgi:hypothetical protein